MGKRSRITPSHKTPFMGHNNSEDYKKLPKLRQISLLVRRDDVVKALVLETEDGVRDRLDLLFDIMVVIKRPGILLQGLRTVKGHDILDEAGQLPAELARRLDVRRGCLRVLRPPLPDGLPVDEVGVHFALPEISDKLADILLHRLVMEDMVEEPHLEFLRHLGPVAPDKLEADDDDVLPAVLNDEAGVALLRSLVAVPDAGHEELAKRAVELELDERLAVEGFPDVRLVECVDILLQLPAQFFG